MRINDSIFNYQIQNQLATSKSALEGSRAAEVHNAVNDAQKENSAAVVKKPAEAAPALRPIPYRPYASIYTREAAGGTRPVEETKPVSETKAPVLDDFSLTGVENKAAAGNPTPNITDEQMDRFLRNAFKVFDLDD